MKVSTSDTVNPSITNSAWPQRIVQSIPASYTIWYDSVGALYYGESNLAGVADITPSVTASTVIQGAITALTGIGGSIFLRKGTYPINTQINLASDISLLGECRQTKLQQSAGANLDAMLSVGTGVSDVNFEGLYLDGNKTNQTGGNGRLIQVTNATVVRVQDNWIHAAYGQGILYQHTDKFNSYGLIQGNIVEDSGQENIYCLRASGTLIKNNHCLNSGYINVRLSTADNCCVDGNYIDTSGNTYYGVNASTCISPVVTDNVVANAGDDGITFSATTVDGTIQGNTVRDATVVGIAIYDGSTRCLVDGNTVISCADNGIALDGSGPTGSANDNIISNNLVSGSTLDGIRVDVTAPKTALRNLIIGNHCLNNTQYGIREQGDSDYSCIFNNIVLNNTAGTISTVGANTKVRNNMGYVTENSGSSSVANGTTSIAVAHGLSVTPSAEDITIIGKENPTNDVGTIWVDTIGAANFTVNVENDPGASGWDFGWKVIVL